MTPLAAGTVIGPYVLVEPIGSGATAHVYKARRSSDDRLVALKLLTASAEDARLRFTGEVAALRRVSHPGIVDVLDAGEHEGGLWLAMDLVVGMPLDEWASRVSGATRLRHILRAGVEVAEALDAAHEVGILHRDIKPTNILVETTGRVRLVDFGFAGHVDRPEEGGLAGTLRYMSPERLSGATVDRRSDLFSLGVVFFELLARRAPHVGKDRNALILAQCTEPAPSVAEFAPEVPEDAVEIIDRLLAKAPSDRPRSGHEVAQALRSALAAEPREAPWRPVLLTSRYVGHRSLIDGLVARILARDRTTIVLHGPPGIGLTRTLQEVEGRVLVRKARPILLRGDARPLFRALEELVGPLRPADSRRALLGEDRDLLLGAWPELRRTTEDVISLARPPTPQDLARAVRSVLLRAAAQQPLLIAVDDADLADRWDLHLLEDVGLLLLATHAPDKMRVEAERIELPPLEVGQLGEVAASMLGPSGRRLAWDHAGSLAGRPGDLERLARQAATGRPALPGDSREGQASAARVRPWQHAVREAETVLANGSPEEVRHILREAAHSEVPGELRFRAELVQARAAMQAGDLGTAGRHATLAEEAAQTMPERSLAELTRAQAVLRSGDPDELAARAAGSAAAARRLGELELAERWTVLQARAQMRAGALDAAADTLVPLVGTPPEAPDLRIGVLWTAAEVAVRRCEWDQCRTLLLGAREAGGPHTSGRVKAGLRACVGHLWLRRGRIDKATEQLDRAHHELARTADQELLALVRAWLAEARLLSGSVDEASRLATMAVETADRADSQWARPVAAQAALRHARAAADMGRMREQIALATAIAEAQSEDPWTAPLAAQLGLGLLEVGEDADARRWLQHASSLRTQDPHDRLLVRLARAAMDAREERLRPETATRLVEEALDLGVDHVARIALGFTMRWTGSAAHRRVGDLVRKAREAGDTYGACWLGIALEADHRALFKARSLGYLGMAEGRALPA